VLKDLPVVLQRGGLILVWRPTAILDWTKGVATMPIYTCTVTQSTFSGDTKRALASEIARIHSSMIHVPSTYVNVAFHELAADGLYAGGATAVEISVASLVVSSAGWPSRTQPVTSTGLAGAIHHRDLFGRCGISVSPGMPVAVLWAPRSRWARRHRAHL
jgi:phenylpyruvate tautomerase PptA (4-oxalocrotonate tautomerase family)